MHQKSRTVRVFLSSTFRDFAEERDLLVRKVFPELRRKCRARQVELVDVDLRWGITEEEAQQGKVLPICLAEIDRSRPFFMGFIGERYGWVPEAEKYDLSLIMEQPWLDEHRGGKSVTELEMLHGVLNNPAMEDRAFFYFRDAAYSNSKGGAYLSESEADKMKLEALKDRIRKSGYPVVENYPSPEALAERVKEDLWRLIDEAFPESEVPDALVQERMRHEQFAASRLGLYLGGEGYFAALDAAMSSEPCRPVLVTGASGGGKSALLANWMERLSKQTPEAFVLFHFLAVGADASHPVGLATRLLKEISRFTGEELVLEGDPRKALHMLSPWLEKAGAFAKENGRIFILVVDALDKLSDTRNLDWWPRKLPDGVRLVLSCLDGEVLDAARTRMGWSEVKVSPLGADDRSKFIEDYFGKYRKSLPAEQKALVLEHALSGNPLFLRTLLEELRVFGVHEELMGRIAHYLASETVDDLFERVLERVESDNTSEPVRAVLEVLWAAKESFAEDELLEVTGLPPAVWAPIHIALDESLIGAGGRLAFSHDYLRKAVQDRYLAEEKDQKSIRSKLAEFCASAMESGRKELSLYIRRHATEHFLESADWDNAAAALSDLEFIEARAIAQELPAMLKDYAEAVKLLPEGEKERQTEAARQAELDRYAKEMVEYSATWSRIRDGSGEAEPTLPRPVKSVRLWSAEEIAAERKRMTEAPNRLDIVKAFRVFVATNSVPLQNYSSQEGFAANLARNDAPAGPVHEEGKKRLEPLKCIKFLKQFATEEFYNPLPACQAVLEGHGSWINSVAMTRDGRRTISGSWDGTLRVWDLETGNCLRTLEGHTDWVTSIALSSDGRRVVSGGRDKTLRVWDIESGVCLQTLEGHSGDVRSIAISADCRRAVSRGDDNTMRFWNLETSQCIKVFKEHGKRIFPIFLSNDGRRAVSYADNGLCLWNLDVCECIKELEQKNHPVDALAYCADGDWVVSEGKDNNLCVWDIKTGACLKTLIGHSDEVVSVAISIDNRRAISIGNDKTLRVWNLESGHCIRTIEVHSDEIKSIVLSSDCRIAASIVGDSLRIFEIESGKCIKVLDAGTHSISAVDICADARWAISSSGDATLRLWNLESGDKNKVNNNQLDEVFSSEIVSNGFLAISGSRDKTLRVWDLESTKCIKVLEANTGWFSPPLSVSGDGCRVLSGDKKPRGSRGHALRLWNLESGECIKVYEKNQSAAHYIALNIDSGVGVSGSHDNSALQVWNLDSGQCWRVLEGHTEFINAISWSACSQFIASASNDKTLRLWDLINSGKCLQVFMGHSSKVTCVALCQNGGWAVSGSQDQTLRVWNLESGRCLKVLEGHTEEVLSIALSADGRLVVSRGGDNTLRLWNVESGNCIARFFARGLSSKAIHWKQRKMVLGFSNGKVEFYSLENLPLGPIITTAHREIISEDLPSGPVTAQPPCCGQLISIPSTITDRIEHWSHEGGEGCYTDPGLLLDCPSCSTSLRMNPFFVDVKPAAN